MRRLLGTVGLLFALGISAPSASAHTAVVSTSPQANQVLMSAPTQVTVTTAEAVQERGTAIAVLSPSGARVDDGSTEVDGSTVLVGLVALSEVGDYTVNYRLLAEDGHPLEGSFIFTLSATPSPTSPSPTPTSSQPSSPDRSFGWLIVAAFIVALSSLALLIRRTRR